MLGCTPETVLVVCGMVSIHGYTYRANIMVVSGWSQGQPVFGRVELIIKYKDCILLFIKPWATLYHDDHFQAYAVKETTGEVEVTEPYKLVDYKPVHVVQNYSRYDNRWYFPTRFVFV